MARESRQFEIGNVYHIINRGVEKRKIFLKNQDYSRFVLALELFNDERPVDIWPLVVRGVSIDVLDATVGVSDTPTVAERIEGRRIQKIGSIVELLGFALMPNHYHLIIREIRERGISEFMQKLGGGYSRYFNQQHKRVGPLFQSRYKSVHIKDDAQLMNVFVYVHTNPVELVEPKWKDLQVGNAGAATRFLENYRWSSYNDYIGKPTYPHAINRDFFLKFYGDEKECRQAVEDWISFKAGNVRLGPEIIE